MMIRLGMRRMVWTPVALCASMVLVSACGPNAATDSSGKPPVGPLFMKMTADAPGASMRGGPAGTISGDTWAARWDSNNFPTSAPSTLAFWVGGPNYVTARVQTVLSAIP
jgi:hypothetical protein